MLVDTHSHINMMVKKKFDVLMTETELQAAESIVQEAKLNDVTTIINVGTSLPESINCIALAQRYKNIFAAVGIHPNDCTESWQKDFKEIKKMAIDKKINKVVGIGECGIDRHYPGYNLQRQKDAFKAHIELALEQDLALIIHSRDAYDETLKSLDEFAGQITRGVIHCFSEDQAFANQAIAWNFVLGIGGTITYPKNTILREVATAIPLEKIILETDAPFLPPQSIRGKQNHPKYIRTIAEYLAELRGVSYEDIAKTTTKNVKRTFQI